MDYSCAWDSAIPERWNAPARGILHFPSGGLLPRVRFRDSRAMDDSCAWDSAFPERWTITAREILLSLGGGRLPRVRFRVFRAVDYSRAWDFVIPERWNASARGILRFLSGGSLPRGKKYLSKAMAFPTRRNIIFLQEIFADSCFLVLSVRVKKAPAIFLQNRWSFVVIY